MKIEDLNWLDYFDATTRANGIGASEASLLLDVSKWVNDPKDKDAPIFRDGPHKLFEVKKGRHKIRQNRAMSWGKVLEKHVVDIEYMPEPGYSVFCPVTASEAEDPYDNTIPSHVVAGVTPHLRCSPDRFVMMGDRIAYGLEIKTSWAYRDDWMLEAYTPQLQWSMLVTGIPKWELFGSMMSRKPDHKYRNVRWMVEADPIMQAEMMDLAHKFWKCVDTMDELPENWRE